MGVAMNVPDWFAWTHHRDHGPDESLLDLHAGERVLDLGCGKGEQLAYLAGHYDIAAVGVDSASTQVGDARQRHGALSNVEFVEGEVTCYLAEEPGLFDAVYSRFGAFWFVDPEQLVPAVAARLRPGGRLVFSHMVPGFRPFTLPRWDIPPEGWCERLERFGFREIRSEVWSCPESCHDLPSPGIMIAQARC